MQITPEIEYFFYNYLGQSQQSLPKSPFIFQAIINCVVFALIEVSTLLGKNKEALSLVKGSTESFSNLENQFKNCKSQYSSSTNPQYNKMLTASTFDSLKVIDRVSIILDCEVLTYILNKKEQRLEMSDINKNGKVAISLFIQEKSIHILYSRDFCIKKFPYVFDLTMAQDIGLQLPKWVLLSHALGYKNIPKFKQIYGKNLSRENKKGSKLVISKLFQAIFAIKGILKEKSKNTNKIKEQLNGYLAILKTLLMDCNRLSKGESKNINEILHKVIDYKFKGNSQIKEEKEEGSEEDHIVIKPPLEVAKDQADAEIPKEIILPTIERDIFPDKILGPLRKKITRPQLKPDSCKTEMVSFCSNKNSDVQLAKIKASPSYSMVMEMPSSFQKCSTEERASNPSLFVQNSPMVVHDYDKKDLHSMQFCKSTHEVTKIRASEKKATTDIQMFNSCVICEKTFLLKNFILLPCDHKIHSKCMAM